MYTAQLGGTQLYPSFSCSAVNVPFKFLRGLAGLAGRWPPTGGTGPPRETPPRPECVADVPNSSAAVSPLICSFPWEGGRTSARYEFPSVFLEA